MKRILVCLDGTWNKTGSEETGSDSNVAKLFRLAVQDSGQVTKYLAGVGTDPFEKIRGGLFGIGLYEQIKEGYGFIVNEFEPGDRVIVTGFSRGAYSARCLASLVATCGVLKERKLDFFDVRDRQAIDDLWDLYKARAEAPGPLQEFVQRQCHPRDPKTLSAVGVWDTVGAMGIPWEVFTTSRLAGKLNSREQARLGFLDTQLPAGVARGYHAVALDEQRVPFRPTLWEGPRLSDGSIHQVWFSGSHSNIGGGYKNTGLSDLALDWMIRQLRTSHQVNFTGDVALAEDGHWQPVEHTRMDRIFSVADKDKVNLTAPREVASGARLHHTVALRHQGDAKHPPMPSTARFLGPFTVDA